MDHLVVYSLYVEIPFNAETSHGYSDSSEVNNAFLLHSIEHIKNVISVTGFISLERIFRSFEMRDQIESPHIFFRSLDNYDLNEKEDGNFIIGLYLSSDFEMAPYRRDIMFEKKFIPKIVKSDVLNVEEKECQTGQKEISASEENETT